MSKRRNIIRKCLLNHAPNKRIDGTYRYFTNLTIESLIRKNIIRRRFVYSYSQNFWAAEISSYTVHVDLFREHLLNHHKSSPLHIVYIST